MLDAVRRTRRDFDRLLPLARGMLSGQLRSLDQLGPDDVRRKYPGSPREIFRKNVALVDQLGSIAADLALTLSIGAGLAIPYQLKMIAIVVQTPSVPGREPGSHAIAPL